MSCSPEARPGSQRSRCSGRARDLDRDGPERLDRQDQPGRGARAAELLDREAQGQQVRAQPAVPLGERDAQDVVARQQPPDVLGPLGVPGSISAARGATRVGQLADRIAEEHLVLGEADEPGRGVRRHRNAS